MKTTLHFIDPNKIHYKWDNSLKPALKIKPGDRVVFELRDVSDNQITPNSTVEDLIKLDWNRVYPLSGPIYIEGAEPGDALIVNVIDIKCKGWGWSAIIPGYGLLEEFDKPYLYIWDLSEGTYTTLNDKAYIPLNPFPGVMGVAPAKPGQHPIMPPGPHGGNMDIRNLTIGSTLKLPVQVEGALFSCGDGHAAQGDGEVCVTAIEAPLYLVLEFNLEKNAELEYPQITTYIEPELEAGEYHATMGISPNLMEAAKTAVRQMIKHLTRKYGFTREEAYILTSITCHLKISEIVDKPNWIVTCHLPLQILIET
ncbi:MAG: acetamidase/formamidase family protein [Candidatus Methanomethylicia archaeon]